MTGVQTCALPISTNPFSTRIFKMVAMVLECGFGSGVDSIISFRNPFPSFQRTCMTCSSDFVKGFNMAIIFWVIYLGYGLWFIYLGYGLWVIYLGYGLWVMDYGFSIHNS